MTPHDAFRVGFLARCADEGLTAEQTAQRIEKAAALQKSAGFEWLNPMSYISPAWAMAKDVGSWALPAALTIPPLAGIGTGYALSQMNDSRFDIEEAKKRELIAAYKAEIERAKRAKRLAASPSI